MSNIKYRFIYIYLLLFSISTVVYAQPKSIKISGNVIDDVTHAPIPLATVFVDGTMIGTTADSTGAFTIHVNDIHKSLVASHIGYYPAAITISEISRNIIALKVREQMLEEVVIRDERLRKQDLIKFKVWFLGTDEWGEKAVLLNDSVLWFTEDKEGFKATADGPLLVNLPELGYTVQTELVDFSIRYDRRYNSQVGTILGYFYFKPYPDGKKSDKYEKNREDVYFNSSQHFLRALYNKNLDENGFVESSCLKPCGNFKV